MVDEIQQWVAEVIRSAVRASVQELKGELVGVLTTRSTSPAGTRREYVSVTEAAEIAGVHPSTVRKLIASGKLGRYSVEAHVRIKIADLHAYMAREPRPGPPLDLDRRAAEILGGLARVAWNPARPDVSEASLSGTGENSTRPRTNER